MSYSPYTIEERFSFITQCYQSGMSIYAWCKDNNIATGTFYSWIQQVKKSGFQVPKFPSSRTSNNSAYSKKQDIVQVEVINDVSDDQPHCKPQINTLPDTPSSVLIHLGDASVEIPSDIDTAFLSKIMKAVRYSL
jgi:transposase-like protein